MNQEGNQRQREMMEAIQALKRWKQTPLTAGQWDWPRKGGGMS
jgi:hypothetical protein